MTYLQLINAVLLRLREQAVTTIDANEYTESVAAMINEAKREVEDAWDWSHLRTYVDLTMVDGQAEYSLTGCNERSRIMYAFNTTKKIPMGWYRNQGYLDMVQAMGPVSGSPTHFNVAPYDTTTDTMKLRLWPTPDSGAAGEVVRVYVVAPQADLSSASTVLKVPHDPVVQGAYLRAINERGEDQGRLSESQALIYQNSLGSHIAIDANKFSDETTWQPI